MTLLQISNLDAGYGRLPVVHDLSLQIGEGEFVALLGPNGAGKSTLAKTVAGLLRPIRGEIRLDGRLMNDVPAYERIALGIGYLPQTGNVFPHLTAQENLEVCVARAPDRASRIEAVSRRFPELQSFLGRRAAQLSGGQRQILALACALLFQPRILILDEPTTGLAPLVVERLTELVREVNDDGTAVIWILQEHPGAVLGIAGRVCAMSGGQLTHDLPAGQVEEAVSLERLLLGT